MIKALNAYLISVMYHYLIIHTVFSPDMTFEIYNIVQETIITEFAVDMVYQAFKISNAQSVGAFMLSGQTIVGVILRTSVKR